MVCCNNGGERGIRTLGGVTPTPDFESGTFVHSVISPDKIHGTLFFRFLQAKYQLLYKTGKYLQSSSSFCKIFPDLLHFQRCQSNTAALGSYFMFIFLR